MAIDNREPGIVPAVILVDDFGRGVRSTGTEDLPAFQTIDGQPVIARLVAHLVGTGVREFCFVMHQMPGLVAHFFGDGARFGARITYVYQQRLLGSGGAIAQASEFVSGRTVLVAPGTVTTDLPLANFVEHHRAYGGEITVALTDIRDGGAMRGLEVRTATDSRVTMYGRADQMEKNGHGDTGIYLIEPSTIGELPGDTVLDWSRDVMPRLVSSGRAFGWKSPARFSRVVRGMPTVVPVPSTVSVGGRPESSAGRPSDLS